MIKKYITLAALLSAGTALANAATEWQKTGETVKITTEFSSTSQKTSISTVGPQIIVGSGYGSNTVSTDKWTSNVGLKGNGEAAVKYSSIVPDIDISVGDKWSLSFTYSLGSLNNQVMGKYINAGIHTLRIDSLELKLGAVDQSGNFLNESQSNDYSFRVSLSPNNSAPITLGQQQNVTAVGTSHLLYGTGPQHNTIKFDFSSSESQLQSLVSPNSLGVTLSVEGVYGSKQGSIGIQSIILNTSVVKQVTVEDPVTPGPSVPEPSAFGLLAGLGALALVASRRRRK